MCATAWFKDLDVANAGLAGGNGANLGELTAAGLSVPPGFADTSKAHLAAIEASNAREKLRVTILALDASGLAFSLVRPHAISADFAQTSIAVELHHGRPQGGIEWARARRTRCWSRR